MICTLFWIAFLFVLYTYVGYPLLIKQLAKQRLGPVPFEQRPSPTRWPSIAIIVPIHNEAQYIEAKLQTLQALDYPKEQVSITFVSDGSDDSSIELLQQHPEVNLIAYHPRAGKPTALNRGVAEQTAEMIIFTDVRQPIEPSAVKRLVSRLMMDNKIGAVSGELVFKKPGSETASQVSLYWRYEKSIRESESRYASVPGVTGALYAIRRADYTPLYPEALLDDVEIPMAILKKGKRIVLESGAEVYDAPQTDVSSEKARKIRTLTGNFQSIAKNPWLVTPSNPILWQFLSHKVFRLLVPYMLVVIFLTSFLAKGKFFSLLFLAQLLFYGVGLSHHLFPTFHRNYLDHNRLANFAKVFTDMNIAAVIALKNFFTQTQDSKWQKI